MTDIYDPIQTRLDDLAETLDHSICQYLYDISQGIERIASAVEYLAEQERKRSTAPLPVDKGPGETIDLLAKWHEEGIQP